MITCDLSTLSLCIQCPSTCLIVHLGQTISCLLLAFPVAVEPIISVNAKYTIRQLIAIIKEQLVYFAKVNLCIVTSLHSVDMIIVKHVAVFMRVLACSPL